jgi:ABC-type uncharacterized transport system auxiliary subunit
MTTLMNMSKRLALLSLIALTGCASLSFLGGGKKEADASIYTLRSPGTERAAPAAAAKGRAVIAVPKPELPPGLETERIALYFQQGHRLDYYAGAKWSAPLDALLQDLVIQKVQQKLPSKVVGTPDLASSAQYKLALKFTDVAPVYENAPDQPPRLDVGMTVTVVSLPRETVRTQFTLKRSVPASANTLTTITSELGTLLQSLTDDALQRAAPYLG